MIQMRRHLGKLVAVMAAMLSLLPVLAHAAPAELTPGNGWSLPEDVSLDGYLQVQARGYAIGMTHLPTQDSVTINLRTAETLDSAAADRYVGTFANSDQSIVWKITRHRLTLMIEHVTAGYRLPAVFLSKTTLLERDGTEIGVTLDASGRAFELRRGSSLLIRK